MKIESVLPGNERCSRKVDSTGTGYFPGKPKQCARWAGISIDGVPFCSQHAGEMALKYLISQQEISDA